MSEREVEQTETTETTTRTERTEKPVEQEQSDRATVTETVEYEQPTRVTQEVHGDPSA